MFSFRCIALSNSCIRYQFGQANKNALHCYTKANRTLGFLRRNLYSCPQEVRLKKAAYKGLVHPVLDYGSSVWDPPGVVLQEFPGNYSYETGSMTGILGQLKWESLNKRRKDSRLILLYKDLKGKASVPTDLSIYIYCLNPVKRTFGQVRRGIAPRKRKNIKQDRKG